MDLKSPKLIYLKGVLFGVILAVSCGLIVVLTRDWLVGVLLGLVVWSSARGYYFMFYVIERYVDPKFRFSGVVDFLRYLATRKSRRGFTTEHTESTERKKKEE